MEIRITLTGSFFGVDVYINGIEVNLSPAGSTWIYHGKFNQPIGTAISFNYNLDGMPVSAWKIEFEEATNDSWVSKHKNSGKFPANRKYKSPVYNITL